MSRKCHKLIIVILFIINFGYFSRFPHVLYLITLHIINSAILYQSYIQSSLINNYNECVRISIKEYLSFILDTQNTYATQLNPYFPTAL